MLADTIQTFKYRRIITVDLIVASLPARQPQEWVKSAHGSLQTDLIGHLDRSTPTRRRSTRAMILRQSWRTPKTLSSAPTGPSDNLPHRPAVRRDEEMQPRRSLSRASGNCPWPPGHLPTKPRTNDNPPSETNPPNNPNPPSAIKRYDAGEKTDDPPLRAEQRGNRPWLPCHLATNPRTNDKNERQERHHPNPRANPPTFPAPSSGTMPARRRMLRLLVPSRGGNRPWPTGHSLNDP